MSFHQHITSNQIRHRNICHHPYIFPYFNENKGRPDQTLTSDYCLHTVFTAQIGCRFSIQFSVIKQNLYLQIPLWDNMVMSVVVLIAELYTTSSYAYIINIGK